MAADETARTAIAPWLAVPDCPRAVQWYADALGATAGYALPDDDGRAVVARLAVDGADFWVGEEPAPEGSGARAGIRLILTVADPGPSSTGRLPPGPRRWRRCTRSTAGWSGGWRTRSGTTGRWAGRSPSRTPDDGRPRGAVAGCAG